MSSWIPSDFCCFASTTIKITLHAQLSLSLCTSRTVSRLKSLFSALFIRLLPTSLPLFTALSAAVFFFSFSFFHLNDLGQESLISAVQYWRNLNFLKLCKIAEYCRIFLRLSAIKRQTRKISFMFFCVLFSVTLTQRHLLWCSQFWWSLTCISTDKWSEL